MKGDTEKMKKSAAAAIAFSVILPLTACGSASTANTPAQTTTAAVTTQAGLDAAQPGTTGGGLVQIITADFTDAPPVSAAVTETLPETAPVTAPVTAASVTEPAVPQTTAAPPAAQPAAESISFAVLEDLAAHILVYDSDMDNMEIIMKENQLPLDLNSKNYVKVSDTSENVRYSLTQPIAMGSMGGITVTQVYASIDQTAGSCFAYTLNIPSDTLDANTTAYRGIYSYFNSPDYTFVSGNTCEYVLGLLNTPGMTISGSNYDAGVTSSKFSKIIISPAGTTATLTFYK